MSPLSRVLPLLFSLIAACSFEVNYDNTAYSCAEDGLCPDGYSCVAEVCQTTAETIAVVDGGTSNSQDEEVVVDASISSQDAKAAPDASQPVPDPDAAPPPPDAAPPAPDATPPEPGSCDALFNTANGYQLCSEEEGQCTFNVNTAGGNCNTACESLGSTCLNAFDNNDGNLCTPLGTNDTCESNRNSEICVCSR